MNTKLLRETATAVVEVMKQKIDRSKEEKVDWSDHGETHIVSGRDLVPGVAELETEYWTLVYDVATGLLNVRN